METPLLVNPLHSTRGLCKFIICKDDGCAMNMHKYMPDISLMTGKSERGNKIKIKAIRCRVGFGVASRKEKRISARGG